MNTDAGALLKLADELENFGHCWCLEESRRATIIAALRQAASQGSARLEAVEECAKVADDHTPAKHDGTLAAHVTGNTIAKAIRALSVSSAEQK